MLLVSVVCGLFVGVDVFGGGLFFMCELLVDGERWYVFGFLVF